MSGNPLVSVIVPNYNYSKYLKQRLDSILNQKYQNFELIILDDCSTDNSREILDSYRDNSHISHIVYNEINSGSTFKQWQKGLDLAKGELVWIAEADDYSEDTFLQELVSVFTKYENVGMVFCFSVIVDEHGNICEGLAVNEPNGDNYCFYNGEYFVRTQLSRDTYPRNVSSAIFCKKYISDLKQSLYANMKISGDRMFYISVAELSNVVYVHLPLNYFRCKANSVTPTRMADGTAMRENYIIDKYLRQNNLLTGWNSLLTWCNRLHAIYYDNYNTEDIRKELKQLYDPLGVVSRPLLKVVSYIAIKQHQRKK